MFSTPERALVVFFGAEDRFRLSISVQAWREMAPTVKCYAVAEGKLCAVTGVRPRVTMKPAPLDEDELERFAWVILCDAGVLPGKWAEEIDHKIKRFSQFPVTDEDNLLWPAQGETFRTTGPIGALPTGRKRYLIGPAEELVPFLEPLNDGEDVRRQIGKCWTGPGVAIDPFAETPPRAFISKLHPDENAGTWWDPKPAVWEVGREVLGHAGQRRFGKALGAGLRGVSSVLSSRRETVTEDFLNAADSHFSVTYVVERLVIAGGVLSVIQLVNELVLRGIDARIATLFEDPAVYGWQPILSRPMVFRDEQALIANLPSTDVAVATLWKTARWVDALRESGKAGEAVYFIQDFEPWFFGEKDPRRKTVLESYDLIEHRIVKTKWLGQKLEELGFRSEQIRLGLNLNIFYPRNQIVGATSTSRDSLSRSGDRSHKSLGAEDHFPLPGGEGEGEGRTAPSFETKGGRGVDLTGAARTNPPQSPFGHKGGGRRPPTIIAMARPGTPNRGYDVLVRVLEEVNSLIPDLRITLFGARELSDLPGSLDVTNLGIVEDLNGLAECYSRADVFLDTSRFQGFGRCGLEAMACGTPCVLSANGGVTEYAEGDVNCLLVQSGDVQAYAEAVTKLLHDRDLAARLRAEGLRTAEELSLHLEADRTIQFLSELSGALV